MTLAEAIIGMAVPLRDLERAVDAAYAGSWNSGRPDAFLLGSALTDVKTALPGLTRALQDLAPLAGGPPP